MNSNNDFIVYNEESQYEVYGSPCIKANSYIEDINKDLKSEKKVLSSFLTVNEYAKGLKTL